MKSIVLLILFLITTFILNVIFYYNSDYYREFLKGLKGGEQTIVVTESKLDKLKSKIAAEKINNTLFGTGVNIIDISSGEVERIKTVGNIVGDNMDELKAKIEIEQEKKEVEQEQEMKLGQVYENILNLFNSYQLKILEINTSLFDLTNEYPDDYFEYYSRNLTVYFFPTKTYEDILDIFNILSLDLPFTINKINNFGDESFYINLDSNINDSVVRIIINYNNIVFGVKVNKSEYENVKKILNTLKIN